MTEAAPNISPAQIAALSPEGRATALAAASKFYDPAATQALFNATPAPAAKIQPDVQMVSDMTEAEMSAKGHSPQFIAAEMAHRAANPAAAAAVGAAPLVGKADAATEAKYREIAKVWQGDPKMLQDAARAAGVDLSEAPLDPAAQAAADRAEMVANAVAPPESGKGYHLQFNGTHDPEVPLSSLNAFYENGFHAADVPAALGQAMVDAFEATKAIYAHTEDPNETADDIERRELANTIRAKEEGARVLALGDKDTTRLFEIGLKSFPTTWRKEMEAVHAFTSAEAVAAVAAHGRSLEMRKKK